MSEREPVRIVILGGGFGGLHVALELERGLARTPGVEVTLVNRENFSLFTPMLHEVAASDLDLTHIVNPIRKLLRRVRFFAARVEHVDLEARTVHVTHGAGDHPHALRYDHLVLALGSVTNFHGLPGVEPRALTMKSLGDAIHLRNQLIANLEEADNECCAEERAPLLTVVVAGGGFAGVETLAALHDFMREALEYYPNLRASDLRSVLVHSGDTILPELDPALGRYAARKLAARGVEIHLGARVASMDDARVTLSSGVTLPTRTLVWTAGTAPHPLVGALPCAKQSGRIRVEGTLQVPGWPGVWALGDAACVPDAKTGKLSPPTAQHALRQGRLLARNIEAVIRGQQPRVFSFGSLGQLAALGRRTGVAQILGLRFSGFVAWWLWRTIYLLKLPRLEKKLRVMLDWTLDLVFSKDLVQFETLRSRGVSHDAAPAAAREGRIPPGTPAVAVPMAPAGEPAMEVAP